MKPRNVLCPKCGIKFFNEGHYYLCNDCWQSAEWDHSEEQKQVFRMLYFWLNGNWLSSDWQVFADSAAVAHVMEELFVHMEGKSAANLLQHILNRLPEFSQTTKRFLSPPATPEQELP